MKALVALEDGLVFEGISFGASGERRGEVVFNTSMTGYLEILTDPSYKGQIVTMTYPLIGNYGINVEDFESRQPFVEGFIVKENSRIFSNWRAQKSLSEFLKDFGILGIEGVDTRALTRHIRLEGAMKAVISTEDLDKRSLVNKAKASPGLIGKDLVKEVSCKQAYSWDDNRPLGFPFGELPCVHYSAIENKPRISDNGENFLVVVLDCGVKYNILRMLNKVGCRVKIVPAKTKANEILKLQPDGLLLSNGPGDPEGVAYVATEVKKLLGKLPIFGICLGHQILGLALGGKTYKLKFGHHGGNHPVKDLKTSKVAITVQNHGFCVDIDSLDKKKIELTHVNLNDNTLEGMRHKELPVFSVQYHPEASPGPHDARYLFEEFVKMIKEFKDAQAHRYL